MRVYVPHAVRARDAAAREAAPLRTAAVL